MLVLIFVFLCYMATVEKGILMENCLINIKYNKIHWNQMMSINKMKSV